jgi:cell division protein FtsL
MKNLMLFLTLTIAGMLCYSVYAVKYEVERLEVRKAELSKTLLTDRNAIRVSWAEWYYLNTPERLQGLAVKYLPLSKTKPEQIGRIEDIPMRQGDGRIVASAAYDLLKPGVTKSVEVASSGRPRFAGSNKIASLDGRLVGARRGPGP